MAVLATSIIAAAGVLISPPAGAWPPARRVPNWEPEFMASHHDYTRRQALAHAREFDVIVAVKGSFRGHVAAMRRVNPRLRILAYQNGGYSYPGSSYPESWYAHTAGGARIKSRDYGNYLMRIDHPEWRREVWRTCRSHLRFSGYDGCFLDSVGPAALSLSYVTGLPIDPDTRDVWTTAAYLKAGRRLVRIVADRSGRRPVVPNGIAAGRAYLSRPSTGILADPGEGAMVELFVRQPFDDASVFRSTDLWRMDVDMLRHAGNHGRSLLCVTKAWGGATMQVKQRLFRYALGTFLLGANRRSYFSFLFDRNTARRSSAWDVGLGRPDGSYERRDDVFQRRFRRGLVLVNPFDHGERVRLRRVFIAPGGDRVRSVWLPHHSALILRET